MNRILYSILVLCLLFSCQYLISQPVLNSNNVSTVGDSYTLSEADTTGINPGAGGENITWDFSNLTVLESDSTDFILAYATVSPENSDYGSDFPDANMVSRVSFTDTEEGVTGTALIESFLIANEDSISNIGSVLEFTAEDITTTFDITYQNPQTFIPFPFTFGDTFTDLSQSTSEFNFFGFTSSTITVSEDTVEADGYGTLVLPSGTFEDVLRITIRSTLKSTDEMGSDTVVSRIVNVIWLQEDLPSFLLSIETDISDEGTEKSVIFRSDSAAANPTSIQSELSSNIGLKLYPNPVDNQLQIQYTLPRAGKMDLAIYDLMGRKITQILSEKQSANTYTHEHSLAYLPAGTYLLKISLDGKADFQRFIKR